MKSRDGSNENWTYTPSNAHELDLYPRVPEPYMVLCTSSLLLRALVSGSLPQRCQYYTSPLKARYHWFPVPVGHLGALQAAPLPASPLGRTCHWHVLSGSKLPDSLASVSPRSLGLRGLLRPRWGEVPSAWR